jgi:hypothetical protein
MDDTFHLQRIAAISDAAEWSGRSAGEATYSLSNS